MFGGLVTDFTNLWRESRDVGLLSQAHLALRQAGEELETGFAVSPATGSSTTLAIDCARPEVILPLDPTDPAQTQRVEFLVVDRRLVRQRSVGGATTQEVMAESVESFNVQRDGASWILRLEIRLEKTRVMLIERSVAHL